jgi:hypothetical protein
LPFLSSSSTKKQLLDQAARAFENGTSENGADRERELERLHAKIGQLIIKRDCSRSGASRCFLRLFQSD